MIDAPNEKPSNTPIDTPKEVSEVSHNLGLDELKDAASRQQVEAYFREKSEIGEVSKGRRNELLDVMREMNRVKAGPDKIIAAILQRLFSKSVESKIRTSYPDTFADLLIEFNINLEGSDDTKEELNENVVFKKARGKVLASIQADITKVQEGQGKYLKPEYVDIFAKAVMRRYMKSMDEDIYGRVTESNVDNDLKIMTFDDWRMNNPSYSDETLFFRFNAEEARQFVGDLAKVKTELTKIDPEKAGMDKALTEFFQKESSRIEGDALVSQDAAISALQEAQKLGASFTSALALAQHRKSTETKLNEVKNLKDKLPDLDVSIEEGYEKFMKNIDAATAAFIAQKGIGKVTLGTKELDDLDKKFAAEKERATKGAEAQQKEEKTKENEPPDPFKHPDEWLAHMGKEMGPIGGLLIAFIGASPLWGQFKKYMRGIGDKKAALEKAPMIADVQDFLRKNFKFHGEEVLALLELKVSDVLKGEKAPPKVRQKLFHTFQEAIKSNGATEGTAGTILDFVEKNRSSWKEPKHDSSEKAA